MIDAEARLEAALDGHDRAVDIGGFADAGVQRHHRPFLGDRPGMDVVNVLDIGDRRLQVVLNIGHRHAGRRGFQQDVGGIAHDMPAAPQDDDGDQHRDERVGGRPAGGHDDRRRDDGADGAEQVAHHMNQGAAHVEVLAVAAVEEHEHADIDGEADGRDHQHGAAHHRLRRHQAPRRLDDDAAGDDEQHQPVAEGDQDLQPLEAIGAPAVGRPAREAEGKPGEREPGKVGEHVAGIGQQRQRAGNEAAGRFDDHERAGDERRPEQAALIVAVAVALSAVAVVVRHWLLSRLAFPRPQHSVGRPLVAAAG